VDGFRLDPDVKNLKRLVTNDYGNLVKADETKTKWSDGYYPDSYAPVLVGVDSKIAVGVAFLYPYLEYQHSTYNELYQDVSGGAQNGTYRFRFRLFREEGYPGTEQPLKMIPPNQTWSYTVTVRLSKPRNWITTLHAYRDYFQNLYHDANGEAKPKDLRPIRGKTLADSNYFSNNPRGYSPILHIHDRGWYEFVTSFINESKELGYARTMLWQPSGLYRNVVNNYPSQFMDFDTLQEETADAFFDFPQNQIELGFWAGRSAQVPDRQYCNQNDPAQCQWDPPGIHNADYHNPDDMAFLHHQLELARDRWASLIGLDMFGRMKTSDRYYWVKEMRQFMPNVTFAHEGSGPDMTAGMFANFYNENINGRPPLEAPDMLSNYLNPGSEIWAYYWSSEQIDYQKVQNLTHWGYTVLLSGSIVGRTDVTHLDLTPVACLDGLDNDNDGLIDFPKDPGCKSEMDNTESLTAVTLF